MALQRLPLTETLESLPPEWPHDPLPAIREAIRSSGAKLVVLDDDPTGAQTVHDVPVLTDWSAETLTDELKNELPVFYVLTNSRSMTLPRAQAVNREVGRNLLEASRRAGRDFVVVSRSDSTLRGHFPGEVEALEQSLGERSDAWILVPFFLEGGRYTINDVHYVAEGEWLAPAGQTEFARDPAFPFSSSHLREWVEEKTSGRVPASAVVSISIEDIRRGGPERVAQSLMALGGGAVCFSNAASMRDLEMLALALLEAERRGKRFLYRTAASFVRARLGQTAKPLLDRAQLVLPGSGGTLVVVGSHVNRTSEQLARLLELPNVTGIEVPVADLLDDKRRADTAARAAAETDRLLQAGRDVVLYTSRQVLRGDSAEGSLSIAQKVSQGLVEAVRALSARPRCMITKGGITSSDIATRGLGVVRCTVPGQALPGVPVWELGPESRFPGLKLVVFPGNVGGPSALADLVAKLRQDD